VGIGWRHAEVFGAQNPSTASLVPLFAPDDADRDDGARDLVCPRGGKRTEARAGAISNNGLPILAELKQLESLSLGSQAINGEGLRHLVGMKNLKILDLQGTSATYGSPAVKQLQQALSGCTISTYTPGHSFFF
jgi:hypothetical protein